MLSQVYYEAQSSEVDPFASLLFLAIMVAVSVFYIACLWRIFTKAGEPGWHAVVPILNTYTLIKVAGRPGWWLLLTFVPCIGLVVMVIVYLDLASQFGKGSGFGIGLVFLSPIFLPILAFGRAQHGATWSAPAPFVRGTPGAAYAAPGGGYSSPAGGYRPSGVGLPPVGGQAATGAGPATRGGGLPPIDLAPGTASDPVLPPIAPAAPSSAGIEPASASPAPMRPPAPAPAEGWYPDPTDPNAIRWWDGSAWTEHARSRPPGG